MLNKQVISRTDLDGTAKLIWHVIHEAGQKQSTAAISAAAGISKSAALRAIQRLEAAGLLTMLRCVDAEIQRTRTDLQPESGCVNAESARVRTSMKSSVDAEIQRLRSMPSVTDSESGEGKGDARTRDIPINTYVHSTHSSITHTMDHVARDLKNGVHHHEDPRWHAEWLKLQRQQITQRKQQQLEDRTPIPIEQFTIATTICKIMESIPNTQTRLARLASEIADWINDNKTDPSIPRRVAEAIIAEQIQHEELSAIVIKINRMDAAKIIRTSRGALFISECRKLWAKHNLGKF